MMLRSLLQTVYPKGIACIVCGRELSTSTRYGICNDCRPNVIDNCCDICGVEITGSKNYCDSCLRHDREFTQARAPFCFENEDIKKLVYALKYGDKTYLAPYMSEFMADIYYGRQWVPDIVTYVPIHKRKRIFVRGYDQAKLIAENLAKIIDVPFDAVLEKTRNTKASAAKLGRADRRRILENTFELIGNVRGKNILLIDDVFTTGATTEECSKVLSGGKARNIWVLTFATSKEKPQLYSLDDGKKKLKNFIKKAAERRSLD